MTERVFKVFRGDNLLFETHLNPNDGVYLSNSVDEYLAHLGAEAPEVEEVVGEMQVEGEESETPLVDAVIAEMDAEDEKYVETDDEYEDWTVDQLKEELGNRGLKVSGTKAELVERLNDDDEG